MTKPIEGCKDYCIYLFDDSHTNYAGGYKSDKPYWCTIISSGDHTEPCMAEDYWQCESRKMYEEMKNVKEKRR